MATYPMDIKSVVLVKQTTLIATLPRCNTYGRFDFDNIPPPNCFHETLNPAVSLPVAVLLTTGITAHLPFFVQHVNISTTKRSVKVRGLGHIVMATLPTLTPSEKKIMLLGILCIES